MFKLKTILGLVIIMLSLSCESEASKQKRLARERVEKERVLMLQTEREKQEHALRLMDSTRIAKEQKEYKRQIAEEVAKHNREQALREKYINNSLSTGVKPYGYCYGFSNTCSTYSCSQIKVKTPYNSDVLVTIKRNGDVYRHAYIASSSTYDFHFPNGTYQTFFYYGKGWNPNKIMTQTTCGNLKGGFIEDEVFGKDYPQQLNNSILTYELILQENGNFSTKPSNKNEAF